MFNIGRKKAKKGIFHRLVRSTISTVILASLVLGVSLFIKQLSTINAQKAVSMSEPVLSKLGVNSDVVGQVAGAFAARLFSTNISPSAPNAYQANTAESQPISEETANPRKPKTAATVAILSDAHGDTVGLKKALDLAKSMQAEKVFYIGDLTDLGTLEDLERAKEVLDASGAEYYALPGDRDLYVTSSAANFYKVFPKAKHGNQLIVINKIPFMTFDNSANFTPISQADMEWFAENITKTAFLLVPQPIYHPLTSVLAPVMGIYEGEEVPKVKEQADLLLAQIRNAKNVTAVVGGDHHRFSRSVDPNRQDLEHIVVGAVTSTGVNFGDPSMTLLRVAEDMSYDVSEITLE